MLEKERIDTATGNAIVLSYLFNQFNMNNAIELPGYAQGTKEQWLRMTKQSTHRDKLNALKAALESLKEDGTFDTILTKHVGSAWKSINRI